MKRTNLFTGKKHLRIERDPDYFCTCCNSFYLYTLINFFGLTRLVVRIRATGYTPYAIKLAEKCFPTVSPLCREKIDIPEEDEQPTPEGIMQYLYCYNKQGDYIGVLHELWELLQYDCTADEFHKRVFYSKRLGCYLGISYYGWEYFKIGDKLFDEHWRPDPSEVQFTRHIKTMEQVMDNMPYIHRGSVTINTLEQSRQAAINFSKYE